MTKTPLTNKQQGKILKRECSNSSDLSPISMRDTEEINKKLTRKEFNAQLEKQLLKEEIQTQIKEETKKQNTKSVIG